ncbi:unnamed protein product [Adineta ricciae]|uniref:Uncharacterized protein n=1 Tax=Adineta ricciae TaxID=249248 RepID=A0A813XPQ8_ADIRI|nr:unnamed protein product [Adineta ricciae]
MLSINECSRFIDTIEIDYYQGTAPVGIALPKDRITHRPLSVITIQTWSQRLNQLQTITCSKDFCSAKAVRKLLDGERLIDGKIIALIERIDGKIRQQLKIEIPVLIERLNDCVEMIKQYFLSFYQIENIQRIIENLYVSKRHIPSTVQDGIILSNDEFLETPYTYEKSRCLHILQINQSLKILRKMSQRIHQAEDVLLSTLSRECQDLAHRCECLSFPFVFVLPECYHRAREILDIFQTWLREDMIYTEFIEKSLKSLDKKCRETKQAWESSKSQYSQIKYRVMQDYSSKCFKRQIYAIRLYKLSHRLKNANVNHTTIEKFQIDIKDLSKELPELESEIAGLRIRRHIFQKHERILMKMHDEDMKNKRNLQLAMNNQLEKERQLTRIVHCRDIVRNIYQCRKRSDLVQRIFYGLPIIQCQDDDLCKTFSIVSKTIGRDWDRLYRELLFHPKRGKEELSNDLKIISRKYQRGNAFQDQAMDALNKCRRSH